MRRYLKAAGGFLIQLLPTATNETIDLVEKGLEGIEPISAMIDKSMTPEEICRHVLRYFELDVLDESNPVYKCYCSRERTEKALISVGEQGLSEMAEDETTEVCCQFCDKKYRFSREEIKALLSKATKQAN